MASVEFELIVTIEPEEVVRIAADRDRYKAALERFLAEKQQYCIEDGHGCYHGWPWEQHIEGCPINIAGKALHGTEEDDD